VSIFYKANYKKKENQNVDNSDDQEKNIHLNTSKNEISKNTYHSTVSAKQKEERSRSFLIFLIPLALTFFNEGFFIIFIISLFVFSFVYKLFSSFKRCSWCDSNKMNLYFIEGEEGKLYWEYRNKDGTPDRRVANNFQKAAFTSKYGCKKCNAITEFTHYVDQNPSQNVEIWRRRLITEGDGIREGFNWLDPYSKTVDTKNENRKGWK